MNVSDLFLRALPAPQVCACAPKCALMRMSRIVCCSLRRCVLANVLCCVLRTLMVTCRYTSEYTVLIHCLLWVYSFAGVDQARMFLTRFGPLCHRSVHNKKNDLRGTHGCLPSCACYALSRKWLGVYDNVQCQLVACACHVNVVLCWLHFLLPSAM